MPPVEERATVSQNEIHHPHFVIPPKDGTHSYGRSGDNYVTSVHRHFPPLTKVAWVRPFGGMTTVYVLAPLEQSRCHRIRRADSVIDQRLSRFDNREVHRNHVDLQGLADLAHLGIGGGLQWPGLRIVLTEMRAP